MPYLSRKSARSIRIYLVILLSISLVRLLPSDIFSDYGFGDLIYGALIIGWSQTIRYRIIEKPVRFRLAFGAMLLFLLYLLRSLRLDFPLTPFQNRLLW
jgi:hypothetical protein